MKTAFIIQGLAYQLLMACAFNKDIFLSLEENSKPVITRNRIYFITPV